MIPNYCLLLSPILFFTCAKVKGANVNNFYDYYNYAGVKIVNGYEADMKDFYYQVSLRIAGFHFCGGTIISDRFVLTAGHCIKPFLDNGNQLSVLAGAANVSSKSGQIIQVSNVYVHPQFNETSLDYDMALAELAAELDFTGTARPIRVANRKKFPLDAWAVASGWGYTSEGGVAAETLQAVRLPLIPLSTCRELYKKTLTPRMFCAGFVQGEKDTCQGDSGGPLVYDRSIIGIVSWGRGCARPHRPGVYTNIYVMRDFITQYAGIV